MIFTRNLIKFGDSLGVTIPKDITLFLDWKISDEIEMQVDGVGQLIIKKKDE